MSQFKRKPLALITDCTDCGVCCGHMRTPPHLIRVNEQRQITPMDGASKDFALLMAAPEEARRMFLDGLFASLEEHPDESPCSWFDPATKLCRFHEFRPGICREFIVGGEFCKLHRKQAGMDGAKRYTIKNGKLVVS